MHVSARVLGSLTVVLLGGCAGDDGGMTGMSGSSGSSGAETSSPSTSQTSDATTTTTTTATTSGSSSGGDTEMTSGTTADPCEGARKCGNGMIDYECGEECDLGEANRDDGECTTQCRGAICGDGLLHPGVEQCDDGNADPDDACPNHCGNPFTYEPPRLVAGMAHMCALSDAGAVRCWGEDETKAGVLGYGSTQSLGDAPGEMPPPDVALGGMVLQIAAGHYHTCALLVGGSVRCWGSGSVGALGYGNLKNVGDEPGEMPPPDVDVGGEVTQIAAGEAGTCALLKSGAVRCWGAHFPEAIGDEPGEMPPPDIAVTGKVAQIHADRDRACVLRENGSVACWHTDFAATEVAFGGFVVELSGNVCGRLAGGALRCIGYNDFGQKGLPDDFYIGDAIAAGDVPVGASIRRVAPGDYHTCAVLSDGRVRCWGLNSAGQLGYGHTSDLGLNPGDLPTPDVAVGASAVDVATAAAHSCVTLVGGKLRCWGIGRRLGLGAAENVGDEPGEMPPPDVPL